MGNQFIQALHQDIEGDVLSDSLSLGIYGTDASLYQIEPLAIVLPVDEQDVIKTVKIAKEHHIPVLPRGGGTSLAGQTVGRAIVIDFSKYMNQILKFDKEEAWVTVQPGLIRDSLNDFLKDHGLVFSPDPATSNRANIGGMVGNNSSGTKSILYGKTVDHIIEMRVILADGSPLTFKSRSPSQWEKTSKENTTEGKIYRGFKDTITRHETEIHDRFPKVMRRVSGYNLDEFKPGESWNLAKLICGSEGTLAVITEVKLNLSPLPKCKSVCTAHFNDLIEALRAVKITVDYKPSAVEILDDELIGLAKKNPYVQPLTHFIEGDPKSILVIEFYGENYDEIRLRQEGMIKALRKAGFGYAFPIFDEGQAYEDVWSLRKNGLGILLGSKSKRKPLAFIEDSAVPVDILPEYITKVREICARHEIDAAMYAHASVGVIHIRPIMDMRDPKDIEKLIKISKETFDLVVQYGGSWSGEHGDGLVRSYLLEEFFGTRLYQGLKEVKRLFDPENIMNPGKIVDSQFIDENLRYGPEYKDQNVDAIFHYRKDVSFEQVVHQCSGVGVCRKLNGTMCPSYHATRDEEHSTRGRANALRLAMSGQLHDGSLTDRRLLSALDLCLSCKACKSECPTGVDMAKLKSEVLQKVHIKSGVSARFFFISRSAEMSRYLAGWSSILVNSLIKSKVFRWLLEKTVGLEKKRTLPLYARQSFVDWAATQDSGDGKEVVLYADTYLNYHEPQIGRSAFLLLKNLGFQPIVAEMGCCQRPLISNGFLHRAKKKALSTARKLQPFMEKNIPILVCEPSCASALNDDIPDLLDDEMLAGLLEKNVFPIEEFLSKEGFSGKLKIKNDSVLHGHCHQKSLYGTDALKTLFDAGQIDEIDSGCCGMAGSFGYEKEHYELSEKIGQQRLFRAIQEHDDKEIIACGFSCRHQIEHFTGRKAHHWVQAVDLD